MDEIKTCASFFSHLTSHFTQVIITIKRQSLPQFQADFKQKISNYGYVAHTVAFVVQRLIPKDLNP